MSEFSKVKQRGFSELKPTSFLEVGFSSLKPLCLTLENSLMKKSLVALAALTATGAVLAQATIYGRSDIGYGVKATQLATGGTGVKQLGVMDGGNAGSRIGFRGTEDLGGGMKAHFVTEQGISPTNGALFGVRTGNVGMQYDGLAASTGHFDVGTGGGYTQGTNRQTYVGLEGGFGTVRVGYQYTTAYEIGTLSGFTNTSEGAVGGAISHLWGAGAIGGTRANGITYISPKLAGAWTVALQMGSGGGRELTEWGSANSADGRTLNKQVRNSLHIDYNQGPLRAALGLTSFQADLSPAVNNAAAFNQCAGINSSGTACSKNALVTFGVYGALTGNPLATTGNETYSTNLTQLAGSYDFGAVKVGATINSGVKQVTSFNQPGAGTVAWTEPGFTNAQILATKAVGNYNFGSRAISFDMPMGAWNIVGGFSSATLDNGTTSLADWASNQLGVKYNMSKRTIVYVFIGNATDNLAAGPICQRGGAVIQSGG